MVRFYAQLDYLRGVQRNFGSGPSQSDMVAVFTKILVVVAPIVLLMAFWYYRHIIAFTLMRIFARVFSSKSRRVIANYLVSKGVVLEVFLYSSDGIGKKLCDARISSVVAGKMQLQLINKNPTGLKLKGQRVICFTKPFTYSGSKLNAFVTFIGPSVKRGSVIKEMSLYTPIRYRFVIRRRHERHNVIKQDTVRVKVWDGTKRKTFWMGRPDLQTLRKEDTTGKKTKLVVENISAGGIRLLIVNPKGQMPPLGTGNQLVMRVSVFNPKSKKFSYFNVIGTIRSRFKGKGGARHWRTVHRRGRESRRQLHLEDSARRSQGTDQIPGAYRSVILKS